MSLAGLLILGAVFLLLRRRKGGAATGTEKTGSRETISLFFQGIRGGAAKGEVEKAGPGPLPTELPERPGTPPPSELAENVARSELEGTGSNRGSVGTWNRGSVIRSEYEGGSNGNEPTGSNVLDRQ